MTGAANGMAENPILLAAGGTGGHVFPAEALAAELLRRGHRVGLVTDTRGKGFGQGLPELPLYRIPAGTPSGRSLPGKLMSIVEIARGVFASLTLLGLTRPVAVVGFGGYPALPLLLAARLRKIPIVIHEQNAVLGRVNRLVARFAARIATSFPATHFLPEQAVVTVTGNPVRPAILSAADVPYTAPDQALRLLVLGGSQGARVLSDVVPAAFAALPAEMRKRLRLVQQCRAEDLERVRTAYMQAGIQAETATFFSDVAQRLAVAHLVVSRSGASSTAEIAVIGRPALLVPYAHAMDDHQTANAQALAQAGGAVVIAQDKFTPERVAAAFADLLGDVAQLTDMAAHARSVGRPLAAQALADLVERVAAEHRQAAAAVQTVSKDHSVKRTAA
ncbi:MAG: undecaprenyldiphospho-muramoylpentapeptide beta-N-acetylglucosaminyltransferase [Ferrovibrio sp.]|uniref:undecaprenyldiphospho-muramoylpentapeptide beta-N-acetylglucosaminyltransferase n=1 Tax=Ferrovibrio sp. TaxID=1917215 RepID=UPI00261046D9|nr:undecaprenyldiphospho-muramoylpentapeptide beta-N-acetylglucosaminyltransferase [Ferrovibrio sp.]MCW0233296.1 undecaprenyldiphospho-muramoylpentapeptide beta-N-acetylglucosaminyltransferase [Ferrovibrio sp.]